MYDLNATAQKVLRVEVPLQLLRFGHDASAHVVLRLVVAFQFFFCSMVRGSVGVWRLSEDVWKLQPPSDGFTEVSCSGYYEVFTRHVVLVVIAGLVPICFMIPNSSCKRRLGGSSG